MAVMDSRGTEQLARAKAVYERQTIVVYQGKQGKIVAIKGAPVEPGAERLYEIGPDGIRKA